ncbi:hypothetical protein K4L44_15470 [Halosquirtibacter laminarini]|uniref:Uncharacterized protein n=1 Tax=Halosquirtibacter laminarini TaxID=3374600 RepID=A0AC61NMP3_9BACT|nr:hypothetical protein K4L44_15470 [Prolixibacteraceae bacterium]
MKISVENYEQFVMDYLEGNLESSLKKEFETFIALNPELKKEIEDIEGFKLISDELVYFDTKEKLYKSESFDNICISVIENCADKQERDDFEDFIESNEEAKKEFKLFSRCILKPNRNILCDFKNALYRNSFPFQKLLSVAALFILLLCIHQLVVVPNFMDTSNVAISKIDTNKIISIEYPIETKMEGRGLSSNKVPSITIKKSSDINKPSTVATQIIPKSNENEIVPMRIADISMEYIKPVGIRIENLEPDDELVGISHSDCKNYASRNSTIFIDGLPVYNVEHELQKPLEEKIIDNRSFKRRLFIKKIGITIASIGRISQ